MGSNYINFDFQRCFKSRQRGGTVDFDVCHAGISLVDWLTLSLGELFLVLILLGVYCSCFSGQWLTWENPWPRLLHNFFFPFSIIVLWPLYKPPLFLHIWPCSLFLNYVFSSHLNLGNIYWPLENCRSFSEACSACRWTQQRHRDVFAYLPACLPAFLLLCLPALFPCSFLFFLITSQIFFDP